MATRKPIITIIGGSGARRSFKAGPPRFGTAAGTRLLWAIMDAVTEFLRSYLVPAGTGLAGDPGLNLNESDSPAFPCSS